MANITPIKKETHQNIKIAAKRDLSHVANQHLSPISAREYAQAATSYPIVLVKDSDGNRYRSVVMLGLETGENLYHKEDSWNAVYIPQNITIAPFSLGLDPEKEKTLTASNPFIRKILINSSLSLSQPQNCADFLRRKKT